MKIGQSFLAARMGRNFDDYLGFKPFRFWANTYAQDCTWFLCKILFWINVGCVSILMYFIQLQIMLIILLQIEKFLGKVAEYNWVPSELNVSFFFWIFLFSPSEFCQRSKLQRNSLRIICICIYIYVYVYVSFLFFYSILF